MRYKAIMTILFLLMVVSLSAQNKWPQLDKSPLDISYYPSNTTFRNFQQGEARDISPKVRVIYSRPQKNGREILGQLIPYGEIWRMGANEATEITLYQDAVVGGTKLVAGSYTLCAEISRDSWKIIFSNDLYIWGAYNRDPSKDAISVTVPVGENDEIIEAFTIKFEEIEGAANLLIAWDDFLLKLPFEF